MMKFSPVSLAISLALFGASGAMLLHAQEDTTLKCDFEGCDEIAPYTIKIINHGEGAPQATNTAPAGRQQNRRVDLKVKRKVDGNGLPMTAPIARGAKDTGTGRGTFWVTENPTVSNLFLGLKVPSTATVEAGKFEKPVAMSIATNYHHFIDRWELRVVDADTISSEPIFTQSGNLTGALTDIEWTGAILNKNRTLTAGEDLIVSVRVYDAAGNYDEVDGSALKLVATDAAISTDRQSTLTELSVRSLEAEYELYNSVFIKQSIPVVGSTVTLRGVDINNVKSVLVNGERILTDDQNRFIAEYILPPGEHEFEVITQRKSGEQTLDTLQARVRASHFFMVGIADLTVGENRISGSVEPLAVDSGHYGGDIFVDGRLAFYLKGKVKGKYLLTAQMDTGTDDVSEVFKDIHRKDAESVFRRIDPDQYYLVYGDDSTIIDDTNSQGKLYLRVDWDKSYAMWGNFNTAFSGTQYAPFNRSLYGAHLLNRSMTTTESGDSKTEVSAFVSEAQTAFRHNEFEGTGGSLYYLRDQDIVLGSDKVWVEVRRDGSEQVVQKIPLERGRDYEIDEFQGRIILSRPLLSVSSQVGPSIIRDEPQPGDNTYLVVDYEFVPEDFEAGNATAGIRARRWLNDHVALGGTWVSENREDEDYAVKGLDLTVKRSNDTYLRFEVAQSESSHTQGSFYSTDGGLTFSNFNSNSQAGDESGTAIGVEARLRANELIDLDAPVTLGAWAKHRTEGFSSASLDTGADTTDIGMEFYTDVSDLLSLSGRATRLHRKNESTESLIALQADYAYTDKLTVSGELRRVNDEYLATGTAESATLAAGKITYDVSEILNVYGIAQAAVDKSGNYQDNTLFTVGAKAKVTDRLSLSGEISEGSRGTNVTLGAEHEMSDTYSVYANANVFDDGVSGLGQSYTIGQRKTVNDKLKIYSEHQFSTEDSSTGVANTVGLSNTFNRYTSGTLSFQASRTEDELGELTERDTLTAGISYKKNLTHLTSKLEYRQDESSTVDTDQWVMTNSAHFRQSNATRWQARLNLSSTVDNLGSDDAKFIEAGIGFAHRPVRHDRLNVLGRYTFLYDLPPISQSSDAEQRSKIASLESIYDVTRRWSLWSLGGKIAFKDGEVRTLRQTGNWIGNDASLAAVRLRYKAPYGVDAMASYHWLDSDASESLRQGALLSLGHSVGDNLQLSVGYNFTDFDDNLGNDDYDVRGWFLSLIGKY